MHTFFRIILKPLSFLPAIFMMYLIFSFSAQDAETSSQLSYQVSHKVIEVGAKVIDADFEEWEIEKLASRFHGSIRKLAHMTEYFGLAVSIAFPLYVYGLRGFLLVLVAGLFCVAFACGDEYHQSMVSGRNPSKRDVAIDSIGIFAGIIFTRIIGWTGRKTIFRPLAKRKKHSKTNYEPESYSPQSPYPNNGYQQMPNYNPNQQPYPGNGYQQMPNYQPGQPPYPNNGYQQMPNYNPNQQPCPNNCYPQAPPNYSQPPYQNGYPHHYNPADYDEADNPDSLSEDMSLKRLMHEIKDQKKSVHTTKQTSRKPHLTGSEIPDNFVDLTEIDLDPSPGIKK